MITADRLGELSITAPEGPERLHNARGFFLIGPQFVTPSDVLAQLIAVAALALAARHYAPDPREERRARKLQQGRDAAARHGRRVRPWEC